MKTFKTLSEFKAAHKAANLYFFERKTMAFFNSKIESGLIGGEYFITSEQFNGSTHTEPRKYTIRQIQPDTLQIKTIGEFNVIKTKEEAKHIIKRLIRDYPSIAHSGDNENIKTLLKTIGF